MANRANTAYITRLIGGNKTDNPKIYPQPLENGRVSLYLLYYLGYDTKKSPTGKETYKEIRQKRTMKLFLYESPRTPEEREHNRQTAEIARKMRYEAEQEMKQRATGYRVEKETKKVDDFLKYYREFIENYSKSDKPHLKIAYGRFVDFLKATPKYKSLAKKVPPSMIDKDMVTAFVEYLQTRSVGEGAHTLYSRFKKVVKSAVDHDVMTKNPCDGIIIKVDRNVVKKEVLSLEEIRTLAATPFPSSNTCIKRAFMFCLFTGLRWCDVNNLTFANVDFSNRILTFTQQKTEGHSSSSTVTIPMNKTMMDLVGKGQGNKKIFDLPSHTLCNVYLRKWMMKAKIFKHISWHCARHSFAVNVLTSGADIKTVSSLMGHSSISMTEKYLRVVDSLKRDAIDRLPTLKIV